MGARGLLSVVLVLTRIASVSLIGLMACSLELHEGVVAPVLAPCDALGHGLCLELTDETGESFTLYGGMRGFTFRWGVEATIRYSVEHVDDPPQDGSSINYRLEETLHVRVDPVGTTYDLRFFSDGSAWFTASAADTVVMGSSTRVACAPELCAQLLAENDATSGFFTVTVELTGAEDTPLRAVALRR